MLFRDDKPLVFYPEEFDRHESKLLFWGFSGGALAVAGFFSFQSIQFSREFFIVNLPIAYLIHTLIFAFSANYRRMTRYTKTKWGAVYHTPRLGPAMMLAFAPLLFTFPFIAVPQVWVDRLLRETKTETFNINSRYATKGRVSVCANSVDGKYNFTFHPGSSNSDFDIGTKLLGHVIDGSLGMAYLTNFERIK